MRSHRLGRQISPSIVLERTWDVTIQRMLALTLCLSCASGGYCTVGAQEIPRTEYLTYVPLEHPVMVRQTNASAKFNLYGNTAESSYRDTAPVDGIDDRRYKVLLDLSVRFAPYMVLNTTAIPMNVRRFMDRSQSFPLLVDTWEISGYKPELIFSDEIDWVTLANEPCSDIGPRPKSGSADCRLLALLNAFDPLAPAPARSTWPDSSRFTVMFFDFPGQDPRTWRNEYEDQFSRALPRAYDDFAMIGSHPFIVENRSSETGEVTGYEFVLQYWFFYPFNDGGNNHEGDWEHINVLITPLDKAGHLMSAEDILHILSGGGVSDEGAARLVIKRVDYYFHNKVFTLDYTRPNVYAARNVWEQQVENTARERLGEQWYWERIRYHAYWDAEETIINTHPLAFIGADNKGTDQLLSPPGGTNRDSHGTFPFPALYKDIGPAGAAEQVSRHFDHRAYFQRGGDQRVPQPPLKRGHVESFAHPDKIFIIPDGERVVELVKVNPRARRDWAWLVLPVRWGYPAVLSPFAGVIPHAETGNLSPVGPSYNGGWNRLGDSRGYEAYLPHKFSSLVPGTWQDGFMNSWGWLNLTLPTVAVLPPFDFVNRIVFQPFRSLLGARDPVLIPTEDVPYRFVSFGLGSSHMILDVDFVDLFVNEDQRDVIIESLREFSLEIGDSIVGTSDAFIHNATTTHAEISLHLGRRFAGENSLRHGLTEMGLDVSFPISGQVWRLNGSLNFWEYSGSLRYNFATGSLLPFLKGGYGLSWYRVENVTTNNEPIDPPNGQWIRRPTITDLSSFLPNTWHIGGGLEWVLIRSYAAIPKGIDLGLRGDLLLYFHKWGSMVPSSEPQAGLAPGILAERPQNPTITRPVFNLALTIGL